MKKLKKEIDYEVGVSPCSCVTKRLVISDVISDVSMGEEETRKSSKDVLTLRSSIHSLKYYMYSKVAVSYVFNPVPPAPFRYPVWGGFG